MRPQAQLNTALTLLGIPLFPGGAMARSEDAGTAGARIERLPRRDREALLRRIEAFISKAS